MALSILVALAGVMGASGILIAAAGAHAVPNAGLQGAASMLLFHAAAILGGASLAQQGVLWRPLMLAVLICWAAGATLFSGDVTLHALGARRPFPMAAPIGGIMLTAAWVALIGAAICALIRRAG
jgi:uncharacterized membrane protein YgdD (TMEM256/DUF423 family)